MAKKFNLKVLIIILATVIILVSATGFSVSYAKWVTGGNTTLSSSMIIGKWSKYNLNDDKEVLNALENDPNIYNVNEPPKWWEVGKDKTPQIGGVLTDSDTMQGVCFYNTTGQDGYEIEITLDAGVNFVIAIFNSVIDTDTADKGENYNGRFAWVDGIASPYVTYKGKIFTAKATGTYKISVHEGGNKDYTYFVSITFIPQQESN